MKLYLIGSLRNPRIPEIGRRLRFAGYTVFDDWFAGGEHADDAWQEYETARGRTYVEALQGYSAEHVFTYDYQHLSSSDVVVLVTPAGKSGHLELGWSLGRGKPGYILLDTPNDRWDVMYRFATGVFTCVLDLVKELDRRRTK